MSLVEWHAFYDTHILALETWKASVTLDSWRSLQTFQTLFKKSNTLENLNVALHNQNIGEANTYNRPGRTRRTNDLREEIE